ncbi:MAG: hypothetical protein IKT58_02830 [Oscillospiraceae bacterium]|nr:hypothetical protein [Oscillospiraceae bacterium]
MKQGKRRTFGLELLRWLLAMAVTVGLAVLGIFLLPETGATPVGVFSVLLLLCIGWSVCTGIRLQKTMGAMKVKEMVEYTERQLELMQADARKEKQKLQMAYTLTLIYTTGILLLAVELCFFAGTRAWAHILSVSLFYGFFSCVIKIRPPIDLSKALKEAEFPELYALSKQAAGEDFCGKIRIFPGPPDGEQSCGLSVMEKDRNVYLLLGPVLPNVLNEEELLMTLRHEFAHVELSHTKEIAKFRNLLTFLEGDDSATMGWIFGLAILYPLSNLALKCSYYFALSSRTKEMEADASAGKAHSASVVAGSFAKICAFNLFWFEGSPRRCLYASEEAPKTLTTDLVHSYCSAIPARQGKWRELLEKELPAKVASHPTFRQRWESLGSPEYSMELRERSEAYAEEGKHLAELSDRSVREVDPEQYAKDRKEAYLEPLEIVTEYEAGDKGLSPDALRPVIRAYDLLGRPEEAEAICDNIIAREEGPFASAYARYWKGMNLLHRYDPEGIAYLYAAMEANSNYTEEGLSAIGEACTRMGLEKELGEYRRRFEALMQSAQDRHVGGINSKTKLTLTTLPEDCREKILQRILIAGRGNLQRVYLIKELVSEDYTPHAFVLDYLPDTEDEEKDRIYDEIFRYLDDYPEDRDFALYDYEPGMKKPLAQFPEALIYEKSRAERE